MKCSNCGLPLSPTRNNCPRCGTPYTGGKSSSPAKASSEPWTQNQGPFVGQEQGFAPRAAQVGMESAPPWEMQGQGGQGAQGAVTQQPGQPMYADVTVGPEQFSAQPPPYGAPWQAPGGAGLTPFQEGRPYPHIPQRPEQKPLQRPVKVGLSIAALCVVAAALILVFVYFMAQGLPARTTDTNNPPTMTPVTQTATATPTTIVSPTPKNPGQQYLDNVQMASSVKPLQPATSFTAGQRMYVSFDVHKSGYACLKWYINGGNFFNFPLQVSTYSQTAASYATTSSTGSGYVEVYWASTTTCGDEVMAQRVDYTVTG